jgi:hypothetical protein
MMSGKCPKCEKVMSNVLLESGPLGNQFAGPVLAGLLPDRVGSAIQP